MNHRRGDRVTESHSIARRALQLASAFALTALLWSVVVLLRGGSWWGPLHAFLVGTVLLSISGASQMFTITWAATAPPMRQLASFQRWTMAIGAALALLGVAGRIEPLTWAGAAALTGGLVALAVSIVSAIRRSLLRRFDLSARFYLAAFTAGIVGVALGGILGTGLAGDHQPAVRLVHSHLNLLGLVGMTILGTLPTFLPTIAHHRSVSGREAVFAWRLAVAGVMVITAGLWVPPAAVGFGSLLIATAALLITVGVLIRIWRKGVQFLAFLQVTLGVGWLTTWAVVDGFGVLRTGSSPAFGGWSAAAVVAGVGQVLAGSLAYLIPVLLGAPMQSAAATTLKRRRWVPLALANFGGLALAGGWGAAALASVGLWMLDIGVRVAKLLAAPSPRTREFRRREQELAMSQPIIYIDHSDIREGKLEEVRTAIQDLVDFVDAHEPQLLSYGFYVDERAMDMTLIAIHPDSSSLELHMELGGPEFRKFIELINLRAIDVYGRPSVRVLRQLQKKIEMLGMGGEVVVHERDAGFVRFASQP